MICKRSWKKSDRKEGDRIKQVKVIQAKKDWVVIIEGTNEVITQVDQKAYAEATARAVNRLLEAAYREGVKDGNTNRCKG